MSQLKKTTTTPLQASLYQLPGGAVCYKLKKALKVCIVKSTVATLCRRFAGLSTTKLIRYRSKSKFFAKNFSIPSPVAHTAKFGPTLRSSIGTF